MGYSSDSATSLKNSAVSQNGARWSPTGTWREQSVAALLALLCGILFLGPALIPGRALVPFPLDAVGLHRAEAAARGEAPTSPGEIADVFRGNMTMGDKYGQSLTWERVMAERLRSGELPLWTREIAGGSPYVPQMAQPYQPWNLALFLIPPTEVYGPWILGHLVLLGWLAYRFMRRLRIDHLPALFGMVLVVLGTWAQCKLHHNVILTASLGFFPVLSSIHAIFREPGGCNGDRRPADPRPMRSVASLGLWSGLCWLSGFPTLSLYITYTAVAWAGVLLLTSPRGARLLPTVRVVLGLGLGALLSLAQMLPILIATAWSSRIPMTPDALAIGALEFDHWLGMIWPDLFSWPADTFYPEHAGLTRPPWTQLLLLERFTVPGTGFNWPETSFGFGAVGSVALATGFIAAFAKTGERIARVFLLGLGVIGLAVATAVPGLFDLFSRLPGLEAGSIKRLLFLAAFGFPVLAAVGFQTMNVGSSTQTSSTQRGALRFGVAVFALVWLISTFGAVAFAMLAPGDLPDALAWWSAWDTGAADRPPGTHAEVTPQIAAWVRSVELPGEAAANLSHLQTTCMRASLALTALGVCWFVQRRTGRRLFAPAAVLLAVLELWHAGHGVIVAVESERVTTPPTTTAPLIAASKSAANEDRPKPRMARLMPPGQAWPFRILLPNLAAFYGIEDFGAYSSIPINRMEPYFMAVEPDEPNKLSIIHKGNGVGSLRKPESLAHPLLDLFSIDWVLAEGAADAGMVASGQLVDETPASTPEPFHLYRRTTALPRATFVTAVEVIGQEQARLARLADATRDVARVVILEDEQAPAVGEVDPAAITTPPVIEKHLDETVVVRVTNSVPGYLRLADPWDPGWIATVNGEATTIYIADHYLRAVYLPPGEHEVEFTYRAWPVMLARWLGLLGLLLILLVALLPRAFAHGTARLCGRGS